ncbi:MAG: sugar transferase [Pseudomonadota bacterium]
MTPGKRALDIGLALILGIALLPLGVLVGAAMLVRDGRPVFYVSERMKGPRAPFQLWKFRTMTMVARDSGVSGGDKAARLTRTGRFLRRTRLDEIPQLWNVLRGDMSFVGPRPPLRLYVERFPALYARVLASRPGITGLATLYYHRHEERLLARCQSPEETDAVYGRACVPRKARLDLIYQKHRSLGMDLRLIAMTAARAFGRECRPARQRRR